MSKRTFVFILVVIVLALAVSGCSHQTPAPQPTPTVVKTEQPPTATPVPPTATPVPPTATPVPPTATATATKQAWSLTDVKTWDLKPYPEGKEPEPQNKVLLADNGGALKAFYIGNPDVRAYFINLAKESMFAQLGPGHGKNWIMNYDAYRKKYIVAGSPEDKTLRANRQKHLNTGIYMEISTFAPGAQAAYFWESWVVYDTAKRVYSVVTRWVLRPYIARFYHLADDSLDRSNQVVDPVENFILWRLDKDGQWRQWKAYADWLHAKTPKPSVYDPAP